MRASHLLFCLHFITTLIPRYDAIALSPFDHMVAGGFATAFADFLLHPIDTIKVVQQSQKTSLSITKTLGKVFQRRMLFTYLINLVDDELYIADFGHFWSSWPISGRSVLLNCRRIQWGNIFFNI